jgi:hypothetical protein
MILEFEFFFLFFNSSVNQVKIWHLLLSKRDGQSLSQFGGTHCMSWWDYDFGPLALEDNSWLKASAMQPIN